MYILCRIRICIDSLYIVPSSLLSVSICRSVVFFFDIALHEILPLW
jgi:hypothetical protein